MLISEEQFGGTNFQKWELSNSSLFAGFTNKNKYCRVESIGLQNDLISTSSSLSLRNTYSAMPISVIKQNPKRIVDERSYQ